MKNKIFLHIVHDFINNVKNNIFLDDLSDAKNQLADMTRRLHELELELRRLENEREELAAAYKEAEAVSDHLSQYV